MESEVSLQYHGLSIELSNNWPFQDVCNKHYESELEEMRAFKNFYKNKRDIDKHNLLFDDGLVSFQRHLWERSDLSIKQKRKYLNGFIPQDIQLNVRRKRSITTFSDALAPQSPRLEHGGVEIEYPEGPASIDWRDYGMVTPVQDQGYTCASWYLKIHHNTITNSFPYSLVGHSQHWAPWKLQSSKRLESFHCYPNRISWIAINTKPPATGAVM